jgi:hypothetical protein
MKLMGLLGDNGAVLGGDVMNITSGSDNGNRHLLPFRRLVATRWTSAIEHG